MLVRSLHSYWHLALRLFGGCVGGSGLLLAGTVAEGGPHFTDLGPRVFGATTHAAAFGHAPDGRLQVYILQDGALDGGQTPVKFIVADVETGQVRQSLTLPGSEGGWALGVASDGRVYAGVYRSGQVYCYDPGEGSMADLGQALPGQSFVYGFSAGAGGEIYGGTFPGAQVFRYHPDTGFSQVGGEAIRASLDRPPTYARAIGFDARRQVLYAGVGPGAQVVRYDLATGQARTMIPPNHTEADFPYAPTVIGSRLFVRLISTEQALVIAMDETGQGTLEATFRMTGLSFGADEAGRVYYTSDRNLMVYDPETKATRPVGDKPWPANSYATLLVRLTDQGRFPGETAVGVCNFGGRIWLAKTSVESGKTEATALEIAPVAQSISSSLMGPDGRIYLGGYLTGGVAIFDPLQPRVVGPTWRGVAQSEGMTHVGGKMYFGGYPGALLYEYDPGQAWKEGANPRLLFSLHAERQDRPFAMCSDGAHTVIMGTVPEYGVTGGALTLHDTRTGRRRTLGHRELGLTDLSIVSCVYLDGVVYAGTSISGGLGVGPTQAKAKLLVCPVDGSPSVALALPDSIPNQTVISAAIVGPDRKIWLMVEGWLVVFDPVTRQFEEPRNLFPAVRYKPVASAVVVKDASLLLARDGWVYGTISGKILFKLDPRSRALTVLTETGGGIDLMQDAAGNLYFTRGINLWRYAP